MELSVEDILENRITELERRIFGYHKSPNLQEPLPETNVIDKLSRVTTFITTALSGRDKINTLNQKLSEIEEYLEPEADLMDLQTDVKLEYILALESIIRENVQQCNKFEQLQPVLNHGDNFKKAVEMSDKLQDLTVKYVKLSKEAEEINLQTKEILSRYNDVIMNISKTLIVLDAEVTKIEEAAAPKKIMD